MGSRWWHKKMELTPSHGSNKHTIIISSQKDHQIGWTEPPQQRIKRTALRWVGEAKTLSWQKRLHHKCCDPQRGRVSKAQNFFLRSEGSVLYIRLPTLRPYMRDMRPPECHPLKANEDYILDNYKTGGNGEPTLKGSCTDSLVLGPSTKTWIWKVPAGSYVKETNLLILKHLPERQENVGTLSKNIDNGSHYKCDLFLPC